MEEKEMSFEEKEKKVTELINENIGVIDEMVKTLKDGSANIYQKGIASSFLTMKIMSLDKMIERTILGKLFKENNGRNK